MNTVEAFHKTIAVDMDGVLCNIYWDTDDPMTQYKPFVFGSTMEGAKDALADLKARGYRIIVHTNRIVSEGVNKEFSEKQLLDLVRNRLDTEGIPYDEIWTSRGKPAAAFYIDDKAIKFISWKKVLMEMGI